MRSVTMGVALVVAGFLLFLSLPRLGASVFLGPGSQAIRLAASGEDIRPEAYERGLSAIGSAERFIDHRRRHVERGLLHHNIGRQNVVLELRWPHYEQSTESLRRALTFTPVQPAAWLLLAQMAYERQQYEEAAEALDWALHTSHYMQHQALERVVLALALWDLIAEDTRVKSMDAIVDAMVSDIDLVASVVGASGAAEDVRERLRSFGPNGVLHWAKFGAAVRRYRHNEEVRQAAYEEFSEMMRALVATSMLITATMPMLADAMTVHDYLQIRRGEHPTREPDSVDEYLGAVLDGLLILGYFNYEEGSALFCVPNRQVLEINVPEFRYNLDILLEQYEREMPNFDNLSLTRSVGLISLELLTVMYPCDG